MSEAPPPSGEEKASDHKCLSTKREEPTIICPVLVPVQVKQPQVPDEEDKERNRVNRNEY